MAKRNVKLPTFAGICKLSETVQYNTANGDDLDEMMFYAKRNVSKDTDTKRVIVAVVKSNRAQLKKFIAESAKYVQAMETVLAHLEANVED